MRALYHIGDAIGWDSPYLYPNVLATELKAERGDLAQKDERMYPYFWAAMKRLDRESREKVMYYWKHASALVKDVTNRWLASGKYDNARQALFAAEDQVDEQWRDRNEWWKVW
jgi:hypothetical protein